MGKVDGVLEAAPPARSGFPAPNTFPGPTHSLSAATSPLKERLKMASSGGGKKPNKSLFLKAARGVWRDLFNCL